MSKKADKNKVCEECESRLAEWRMINIMGAHELLNGAWDALAAHRKTCPIYQAKRHDNA